MEATLKIINLKDRTTYQAALLKWGKETQFLVLMEESAEVAQAASKLLRCGFNDQGRIIRFMEEVGDLETMMENVEIYFENIMGDKYREFIDAYKKKKLEKIRHLLNNEEAPKDTS